MNHPELPLRDGPPGRHGDGIKRLSDAEDSVVLYKSKLGRRQEEEDQEEREFGWHSKDHPVYDQSRARGRESYETHGGLLDDEGFLDDAPYTPSLSTLKNKRDALKAELIKFGEVKPLEGARRAEAKKVEERLYETIDDIQRLEFEECEGGKMPQDIRELFRPRGREDYSNEESDGVDYEPRGPRRGHPESLAAYARYSTRSFQ